jgi:hypothetical protein
MNDRTCKGCGSDGRQVKPQGYRSSRGTDQALQTALYSSSRAQKCLKDRRNIAKLGELPAVIPVRDQLNALGSVDARIDTRAWAQKQKSEGRLKHVGKWFCDYRYRDAV